MKKKLKNPKIIVSIILITITIALGIVNAVATVATFEIYGVNGKTEVGVNSTVKLNNAQNEWGGGTNQLFADNPELFCIEHGEHIGVNPTYKVSKKHEVQDPMLIYILNMDNRGGKTEQERKLIENDLKQQLIWWYLNNNSNNDVTQILGGVHNANANVPDELIADFEAAKDAARNYKNYIEGSGISISETKKINEDGIDKLSVTVTGTFESWDIYINNSDTPYQANISSTQKTIKIPLSELNNINGYVVVHVKAKIKPKTATVFILSNANDQRLMYVVPGEGAVRETDKIEEKVQFDINVSLQKYITKVNNHGIEEHTSLTDRKNTMTKPEEASAVDVNISKSEKANFDIYKANNTVKIKAGDSVTYRIHVYNNSDVAALNVRVAEVLPYIEENGRTEIYAKIDKITTGTNATDIKNQWQQDSTKHYIYRYKIPSIPANGEVYFDVTLKFNRYSSKRLLNTAWISSSNVGGYRTLDRDFVKMEDKYEVSLEKYVSHVNDVEVSNREGHRYNENATGTTNKDLYKKDANVGAGPVEVDVGDIVTFKIKLKNESNTSKVKITQIYDRFTYKNDESRKLELLNGTGNITLQNDTGNIILQNGSDIEITKYDYDLTEAGQEAEAAYERYRIKFKDAKILNPGESVYVTIQFKVISNSGSAVLNYSNKAGILELKNENDIEVPDNNGTEDNYDMDWLVAKQYKVSLEKFVSQVNGVDVTPNRAGHPTYNENGFSKVNNKVEVEAGDLVTFTIRLKNESDSDYANVKVTKIYDEFNDTQFKKLQLVGAINGNGGVNKTSETKILAPDEIGDEYLTRYEIEFANAITLTKKQSTDVTITFKVLENSSYDNVIYMNRAGIIDITNEAGNPVEDGDGEQNNHDRDYLWLNRLAYSVSLEKYVTEVTDGFGHNRVTYNREGHRYNENLSNVADGTLPNKDTYKKVKDTSNPGSGEVQVEIGDIVTFKIKLKNTGNKAVKVTQLTDKFTFNESNGSKLELYNNGEITGNGGIENQEDIKDTTSSSSTDPITMKTYTIKFNNAVLLNPGNTEYITIKFRVTAESHNVSLRNKATISPSGIKNKNDVTVYDSDGTDNNVDTDWLITKEYKVSLEKFVSKVEKTDGDIELYDYRENHPQYWQKNTNDYKYKRPVTVSNGDKVTYTIKLKNDSEETKAIITNVADYLPDGIKYGEISNRGNTYCTAFEHKPYQTDNGQTDNEINFTESIVLLPGQNYSFDITVEVIEPNVSLNVLKNVAEIISMKNRNDIAVTDSTRGNNKDADYIQLDWGGSTVVDLIVEKQWEDDNNVNKKRPASIQVQLYRNGFEQGEPITLSAENNWEYTWTNKQKYHPNGSEYVYTIKEISTIDNYVTTYNITGNKTTIINKYETTPPPNPDPISKTVTKEWLYDSEDVRPDSIKVQLLRNGEVPTDIEDNKVTLNAANNWKYTWNNLEKCDANGAEYIYQVRELTVLKDYNVEYSEDGFKIINKYDVPKSPDVIIGGYVWNDIAIDKIQGNYDGILDTNKENVLEGINVYLYRKDVKQAISVKVTNKDGYYSFANKDIDRTVVENQYERYIKGPKATNPDTGETTQRWAGTYYSYYVVFEYDGITYTSTPNGTSYEDIIDSSKDYKTDSNAREDNGRVKEGRSSFNNKFSTINNENGIEYTTKNENGYIPQSNHVYNSNMAMQSSTELLSFSKLFSGKDYSKDTDLEEIKAIEDKIKYVGLGLRGRDIFDLELTSDVDTIKVTVNNQQGVYRYSNKVNLRQQDLKADSNIDEDMANKISESSNTYVDRQDQNIRNEDFDVTQTGANKTAYEAPQVGEDGQGVQAIEVTYKITVQNTSNTDGMATEITNYYDKKYNIDTNQIIKGYYYSSDDKVHEIKDIKIKSKTEEEPYNSVVISINELIPTESSDKKQLSQSEKMEIYVVYTLNTPINDTLSGLKINNPIPTYNMAEITEYTTQCAEGQTEYTRGLIDKDSAPGSVNKEQVRLTKTEGQNTPTTGGNPTTLNYYFAADELEKLKYEDDTYATPTLYFVISDENIRTITGKVFRDSTVVDTTTRIKTGNGIYEDTKDGEVGVYGATVQLIEQVGGGVIRYETTTDENGDFNFTGFLPGNYIIRYYYGDTVNTVLLNQGGTDINKYSFNGEDYQSTNNAFDIDGMDTNQLSKAENFWYAYNEEKGISTAIDNLARRGEVSSNVIDTTDDNSNKVIDLLNRARANNLSEEQLNTSLPKGTLIEQTKMFADTKSMLLTVEKTELVGEGENKALKQREQFSEYKISNMNFGIAEVPVTIIDLQKEVKSFTITDSIGQNILAAASKKDDGTWDDESIKGEVIVVDGLNTISVQIEDEKLQGARLQTTYSISTKLDEIQLNYDKTGVEATIKELVDIIDNNLSYNEALGSNSTYWEIIKPITSSSLDNISNYSTMVRTTVTANQKLNEGEAIEITLEKVLSSTNATIEEIITSTGNSYEYENIVEITDLHYENVTPATLLTPADSVEPQRDRIRTEEGYIIIPGVQHDTASAEAMAITPPTGDSSISTVYYIIAGISLVVLAVGVFGIKKFVVNTKK